MPCIGNTEEVASSSRSDGRGAIRREVFGLVRQRVVDNMEHLLDSPLVSRAELYSMIAMVDERVDQLSSETDLLLKLVLAFPDTQDLDVVMHTKALLRGLSKYTCFALEKAKVVEEDVNQLMLRM